MVLLKSMEMQVTILDDVITVKKRPHFLLIIGIVTALCALLSHRVLLPFLERFTASTWIAILSVLNYILIPVSLLLLAAALFQQFASHLTIDGYKGVLKRRTTTTELSECGPIVLERKVLDIHSSTFVKKADGLMNEMNAFLKQPDSPFVADRTPVISWNIHTMREGQKIYLVGGHFESYLPQLNEIAETIARITGKKLLRQE